MSRANNLLSFPNIVNANMTTQVISPVTNIQFLDNVGIQLNFTGTPTGTFTVQVSADYAQDGNSPPNVINPGNFIPVNLPQPAVAAGAPGNIYIDLNELSAPWIRVVYTPASGTGTLNGFITAKKI